MLFKQQGTWLSSYIKKGTLSKTIKNLQHTSDLFCFQTIYTDIISSSYHKIWNL